jgi:hypothetical protein
MRPDFPFPQIATGDLDIAVVGQLPPPKFPLGDQFEPGPVKVVGFEAALRRRSLRKQGLEYAPRNAHCAFILADADAELDGQSFGVPPGVGRKTKEHEVPPMEAKKNVRVKFSNSAAKGKGVVEWCVGTGWTTPLGYLFCVKPKYARAPATRTPSQLTQNGMLNPPISTCHPKLIRRRWRIATTRNSAAVTVI